MCDKHGTELGTTKLTEVTYLPSGKFNLFSLTKMHKQGWLLHGNKEKIWLTKDSQTVTFDMVIPTNKGLLFALYFKREPKTELAAAFINPKPQRMPIEEAHNKFGHGDEASTRRAAAELGIEITRGMMRVCEACTMAKAKQKNVPKESGDHEPANEKGRRIFLDIATIKQRKQGPNVHKGNWRIMVDEQTQLKFSGFYETKDEMVEPTCEQFHRWQQANLPVKFVRMDGAGENLKLKKRSQSKDWKLKIDYEITARAAPQQNHLAELGFATLANRGRALMYHANVPLIVCYKIFKEAFTTATKLDGFTPVTIDGKTATRYVHFFGSNPKLYITYVPGAKPGL
jgi:hypothetical protein